MPRKIEISHRTIVFTVIFLLLLWFVYYIRDIIWQVFIALLIMSILNPLVARLAKLKIPKAISVLIVYFFVLGILGLTLIALIPPLIEQTTNFGNSLPGYLNDLNIPVFLSDEVAKELTSQLGKLPGQIIRAGISFLSNILNVLMVFILAFYLLLTRDKLATNLVSWLGEKKGRRAEKLISQLEVKLGGWVRGQIVLMLMVGFTTYVGLKILNMPLVLPLSLLAGILEVIPLLGPILAAIPAAVVGFGISPLMGLAVIALAFLIQQIENYVFVPKVMEKTVGMNPVIILLALLIGFRVAGVPGAIFSIPVVLTLQVAGKDLIP